DNFSITTFTNKYSAPNSCKSIAVYFKSSTFSFDRSSNKIDASIILGVMTVASGINFSFNASIASSFNNLEPILPTITGSTTIFFEVDFAISSAVVSITSFENNIPVFRASKPTCISAVANWASIVSIVCGKTFFLVVGSVATIAVTTLIPYTSNS